MDARQIFYFRKHFHGVPRDRQNINAQRERGNAIDGDGLMDGQNVCLKARNNI